jgi:hypothetical protein
MGPPASSSGFGGVGGTKPLQVRSQSPAPSTRGRQQHGPPGGPVVVNFPTPNLVPSPTGFPSTPSTASYTSSSPGGVAVGQLQQQQRAVKVQLPIIANSQPVAPILAAPPKAHFAGGAGGDAPASPQLRGFDSMKEKAATFREDDTEVLNPFSPYARQEGPRRVGRSNLNPNGRKTLFRPYSTVDFWKRFSTMGRVHEQQGKESTWITERKRSIWSKPLFVVPLILTICAVGAIIAYLAIKLSKTTSAGSPEVSAASR